jgi:hypothetical protein
MITSPTRVVPACPPDEVKTDSMPINLFVFLQP